MADVLGKVDDAAKGVLFLFCEAGAGVVEDSVELDVAGGKAGDLFLVVVEALVDGVKGFLMLEFGDVLS